nr:conserved hypothetical protein [Serratia symbiotica]CDS57787.1 conserved hypothetical protein [Serratia symbiotica]
MIVEHYEAKKFPMNKTELIQYLMRMYKISWRVAEDALRDNDWDLMMAAGDIRDELNAEV